MTLQEIVTALDRDEEVHLARILVLLSAFKRQEGPEVEGITKLAKLDFLLRYPSFFERAMLARNVRADRIPIESFERNTVEAEMVRYRFGPWDHRYRRFLNVLAAKGLIKVAAQGRAITILLTEKGVRAADTLAEDETFSAIKRRAELLRRQLDLSPTKITEFVYRTFPEIISLSSNAPIRP